MIFQRNGTAKDNPKRRRTPALVRPAPPQRPFFQLTPRDVEIIEAVYTYRALTARHIADLFFGENQEPSAPVSSRCQRRLRLLFQHGYLFRDAPPARYSEGKQPLVYFLDKAAVPLLAEQDPNDDQPIDWHPRHNNVRWPFLSHLLATNDVRVALARACAQEKCTVHTWHDERTLRRREMKDYVQLGGGQGRPQRLAVIPDGYCHLTDRRYHYHQFFEIDMGTEMVGQSNEAEARKTFARKIRAYLAYYRSGQYTRRYGTQAMRVLVVTTSATRLANLKTMTEQVGGGQHFWFTTFDQIDAERVLAHPIWQVAGDARRFALLWQDMPQDSSIRRGRSQWLQESLPYDKPASSP